MGPELRVQVSEEGAHPERVEQLARMLRDELLQLPVEDVTRLRPAEPPPPGTRGIDVAALGGLLVTLGGTAENLRAIVTSVAAWLRRGPGTGGRTVRLEIGGDTLELSGATVEEQQRLIDLFVGRHTPGGAEPWTANDAP